MAYQCLSWIWANCSNISIKLLYSDDNFSCLDLKSEIILRVLRERYDKTERQGVVLTTGVSVCESLSLYGMCCGKTKWVIACLVVPLEVGCLYIKWILCLGGANNQDSEQHNTRYKQKTDEIRKLKHLAIYLKTDIHPTFFLQALFLHETMFYFERNTAYTCKEALSFLKAHTFSKAIVIKCMLCMLLKTWQGCSLMLWPICKYKSVCRCIPLDYNAQQCLLLLQISLSLKSLKFLWLFQMRLLQFALKKVSWVSIM